MRESGYYRRSGNGNYCRVNDDADSARENAGADRCYIRRKWLFWRFAASSRHWLAGMTISASKVAGNEMRNAPFSTTSHTASQPLTI